MKRTQLYRESDKEGQTNPQITDVRCPLKENLFYAPESTCKSMLTEDIFLSLLKSIICFNPFHILVGLRIYFLLAGEGALDGPRVLGAVLVPVDWVLPGVAHVP